MKNIKLIVSDLDGTLLKDNHQVPLDFWKIQKQLQKQNIQFAIASGRQYYTIENQFNSIKNDIFILGDNGAFVKKANEEIFINEMPKDDAFKFINICREIPDVEIIVCAKNSAYIESNTIALYKESKIFFQKLEIVEKFEDIEDQILKVSLVDFIDAETHSYPLLKKYEDEYKIAIAAKQFIDISRKDANKGTAVKYIQNLLGISKQETMIFGDMFNDSEMLQCADYSFAMKNAHDKIKEIANFQTEFTNDQEGVIKQLEILCNKLEIVL